jgi:hypothetical protein
VEVIRVGGLDDIEGYKPDHELFVKSKRDWVPAVPGAQQNQTMP